MPAAFILFRSVLELIAISLGDLAGLACNGKVGAS